MKNNKSGKLAPWTIEKNIVVYNCRNYKKKFS